MTPRTQKKGAPRPRKPIEEAHKEVASSKTTKAIAKALPQGQRKRCPGCNRQLTPRASGVFAPHKNEAGEPCDQKKRRRSTPPATAKKASAGKKYPCAVPKKDGCGRMIGLAASRTIAAHKRDDGSPCPGSDLKPGSPVPSVKPIKPLKKGAAPARPFHDRMSRSEYFATPGIKRSMMKAAALQETVEQYGWETTQRVTEAEGKVELTFTRGAESIHIYWVDGVCAGEDITYLSNGHPGKLRNASAVKMRAAVQPDVAMAEVKRKTESLTTHQRQAAKRFHEAKVARKRAAAGAPSLLQEKLAALHDEDVVKMLANQWIAWKLIIYGSGKEDIAHLPEDQRQIKLELRVSDNERVLTFNDAETRQTRTLLLSRLTKVQPQRIQQRKNHGRDDDGDGDDN